MAVRGLLGVAGYRLDLMVTFFYLDILAYFSIRYLALRRLNWVEGRNAASGFDMWIQAFVEVSIARIVA